MLVLQKIRVHNFAVSLDGYAAGPKQDLENPLGKGGLALHQWFFKTQTFRQMHGQEGGEGGIDNDMAARCGVNVGAWIIGRNMFGPVRGPWRDESWKGWWGDNPPYHADVFVLTNHARASLRMEGGTVFHFVTGGVEAAVARAKEAAAGRDVIVGGGVSTLRQCLRGRLLDELHLVHVPILLGSGEALLAGIDLPQLGYRVREHKSSDAVTHVVLCR